MTEYERRKEAIRAAYRKLADEGFMKQREASEACEALDTLSAADVAVEYKLHVTWSHS